MVVVMQEGAREEQIQHVIDRLVSMGFDIHRSTGASQTVLGAVGVPADFDPRDVEVLDGVREVVRITQPYKLASRAFRPQGTIVELPRGVRIGGTRSRRCRGAVFGGNARTDRPDRGSRRESRRQNSSRRGVQAAQLALQFSGARRKGAEDDARGGGQERLARLQRSHGRVADSDDAALRGYFSGRRAQHAELFFAPRAGNGQRNPCFSSGACPRRSKNSC